MEGSVAIERPLKRHFRITQLSLSEEKLFRKFEQRGKAKLWV